MLRNLVQSRTAFNKVDRSSWKAMFQRSWSSTAMKEFPFKQASSLRSKFWEDLFLNCPGVAFTVDEGSSRSFNPLMGITVSTVNFDFELTLWSPGMHLIEEEATCANLLQWLSHQLHRIGIQSCDVSSIYTDNASNISKVPRFDLNLNTFSTYCLSHFIHIAVKRVRTSKLLLCTSGLLLHAYLRWAFFAAHLRRNSGTILFHNDVRPYWAFTINCASLIAVKASAILARAKRYPILRALVITQNYAFVPLYLLVPLDVYLSSVTWRQTRFGIDKIRLAR